MFDFGRKHLAAGLIAGTAVVAAERSEAASFTEPAVSTQAASAFIPTPLVAEIPITLAHTYYGATSFMIDGGEGGWGVRNLSFDGAQSASALLELIASLNGSNSTVVFSQTVSYTAPNNFQFGSGPVNFAYSFPAVDLNQLKFRVTLDPGSGANTWGNVGYEVASQYRIQAAGIPEPASIGLIGCAGLALLSRRRRLAR